jgi:protein-tyrosine phosphatase
MSAATRVCPRYSALLRAGHAEEHAPVASRPAILPMKRYIKLEGSVNFRDLGGYRTRHGKELRWYQVFRSDALHLLSERDVLWLRQELRIGDIIDLRSTGELESDGRGRLATEPIRFHHIPLFDGIGQRDLPTPLTLADSYVLLAEFAKARIARVITTLAETTDPAVYHCAAGKDRTGVISAVLLGLLDVDDEVIVADYALSQEHLKEIVDRVLATKGYETIASLLPPDTLHAERGTMMTLLDTVRARYGSMHGYARAAGVSDATIQQLQARLLV